MSAPEVGTLGQPARLIEYGIPKFDNFQLNSSTGQRRELNNV